MIMIMIIIIQIMIIVKLLVIVIVIITECVSPRAADSRSTYCSKHPCSWKSRIEKFGELPVSGRNSPIMNKTYAFWLGLAWLLLLVRTSLRTAPLARGSALGSIPDFLLRGLGACDCARRMRPLVRRVCVCVRLGLPRFSMSASMSKACLGIMPLWTCACLACARSDVSGCAWTCSMSMSRCACAHACCGAVKWKHDMARTRRRRDCKTPRHSSRA